MLNKTQFSIEVNSTYFDSTVGWDFGKYLDTPRTIEPCSRMIYSVVNKSYFGAFAGVSGGTGFKLKLEGASEDWYFTVVSSLSPNLYIRCIVFITLANGVLWKGLS